MSQMLHKNNFFFSNKFCHLFIWQYNWEFFCFPCVNLTNFLFWEFSFSTIFFFYSLNNTNGIFFCFSSVDLTNFHFGAKNFPIFPYHEKKKNLGWEVIGILYLNCNLNYNRFFDVSDLTRTNGFLILFLPQKTRTECLLILKTFKEQKLSVAKKNHITTQHW